MNGEAKLNAFIEKPCKKTAMAFVSSIFTLRRKKGSTGKGSYYWLIKWNGYYCDFLHRKTPYENCTQCPFRYNANDSSHGYRSVKCLFTAIEAEAQLENRALSTRQLFDHKIPPKIVKHLGQILMGAVLLRNTLDLKRENKHA